MNFAKLFHTLQNKFKYLNGAEIDVEWEDGDDEPAIRVTSEFDSFVICKTDKVNIGADVLTVSTGTCEHQFTLE